VKEQLQRAKQALEAEPAPAASAADAAPAAAASDGAVDKKAQARAKKADDYHARHKSWVAEFNELTGGECAGGEGGVKWAAVRAWQQKHWQLNNLLADGLVGPKTLEAAKLLQKKNAPKKEGADEKDGAAGPEKEAAGHSEGAEASADKPNLEEESAEASDDQKVVDGAKPKESKHHKGSPAAFEAALARIEEALSRCKMPPQAAAPTAAAKAEAGEAKDAGGPKAKETALDLDMPAPAALEKYDSVAQAMIDKWPTTSPHERCDRLFEALNQALDTEEVPRIREWIETSSPTKAGQFHARDWNMELSKVVFGKGSEDAAKLEAVKTVFHEGRHAHQRFAMARLLATQGKTEPDIVGLLQMNAGIVQQAMKAAAQQPMDLKSTEAKAAGAMVEDAGVHGKEHRATEMSALELTNLGNEAVDLYAALPDKAPFAQRWADCKRRMHEVIDAYHNLPTEHDTEAAEKSLKLHPPK